MNVWLVSFMIAFVTGVIMFGLSLIRTADSTAERVTPAITTALVTSGTIFWIDVAWFYYGNPPTLISELWVMATINLIIAFFLALAVDMTTGFHRADSRSSGYGRYSSDPEGSEVISGASVGALALLVVFLVWSFYLSRTAITSDRDAKITAAVANLDPNKPIAAVPQTDAEHMVIVPDQVAAYKANSALGGLTISGYALNTVDNLGPATLQAVNGQMWWVFQLQPDGAANKNKQHGMSPGYLMVSAENPDLDVVQRIGKDPVTGIDYTMKYYVGGGQDEELTRHLYLAGGYTQYEYNDPTLEISDDGRPYYTVALTQPLLNWDFYVPKSVAVIDANTGAVTRYDVGKTPGWIDRVYSRDMVTNIMNWWGEYKQAKYNLVGGTDANRYQVSGDPVLVYTKTSQHPEWRILMTSKNADTSVNYVILFDAMNGTAQLYRPDPKAPLAIESRVLSAFESTGNGNVVTNKYKPTDLALHMIYGQLTWVVSYLQVSETGQINYQGVGLLAAHDANSNRVVFANNKPGALTAYQTQIAGGTNNSAPEANGRNDAVKGKIANRSEVVEKGETFIYLVLSGDPVHVYRGQADAGRPELIFSKVGDSVTLTYLNVNDNQPVRNIEAFDDTALQMTR